MLIGDPTLFNTLLGLGISFGEFVDSSKAEVLVKFNISTYSSSIFNASCHYLRVRHLMKSGKSRRHMSFG